MRRLSHTFSIIRAYIWLEFVQTLAYPMAFALSQLSLIVPIITFRFVSELVDSGPSVAFDYYTFAVFGSVAMIMMAGALQGFGSQLESIVQNGLFEMLLVEPIPWKVLPFAVAAFPVLARVVFATLCGVLGVALGATIELGGLPQAALVILLGLIAAHGIAILACSVKVLSKRGDPILAVYGIIVGLVSGALFPVQLLPPVIRAIAYVVPHYYVIVAMRRVLMTRGDVLSGPSYWGAILALLAFIAVIYPIALWLYGRALQTGRKFGLLAGY